MKVEIEGCLLNYETQGEGDPILLLHGWGASIEAMRSIANCAAGLGYCAVSLDFPGFGESGKLLRPWTLDDYARVTRGFIERLDICGCDVIGHSHGGRVAIRLASEDSALFCSVVLVDAAGIRPRRGLKYYFKVYSYKLGKRLARISWLDRLFSISERQKDAGSADYKALGSDAMRKTFVNLVNEDLRGRVKKIENETLLIWGSEDRDTPLYMARYMEKHIKNAGLAVLEGAGHYSYADNYAQFCAVMKAFFGGRQGR